MAEPKLSACNILVMLTITFVYLVLSIQEAKTKTLSQNPYSRFQAPAEGETKNPPRVLQNMEPYSQYSVARSQVNTDSLSYILKYTGTQGSYENSRVIPYLSMIVTFDMKYSVRVKISSANETRWEIPESDPFPYFRKPEKQTTDTSCCKIDVVDSPFSLTITRKDNEEVIFTTKGKNFVFTDYYLELTTLVPSPNIDGYGERNYNFKLDPGMYTIWGRDEPKMLQPKNGGGHVYGHHPVGLVRGAKGDYFIVLLRNSNAMDVVIGTEPSIGFKVVGGIFDFVFFVGDKRPDTVIKYYHDYIGHFVMMPFWSMGLHQSRWGYTDIRKFENVINKYAQYDIPLDVIWSDIDYMVEKEDFTMNTRAFPPDTLRTLLAKNRKKWVPIIDAGIKAERETGQGKKEGEKLGVFVRKPDGSNYIGEVWPGKCYFPDFFHPKAEDYWFKMFQDFHDNVRAPFSGIWLDMNEIAVFVDGRNDDFSKIPYRPGWDSLNRKTVSMDAMHYGGIPEYNVHELFSILQNKATYKYLKTLSPLPFILTRSSSFGTGQFSAHWTGDNGASWEFLQWSIGGNFVFQIFGMPFVGADICGFFDDTTPELCARWIQLGALYPFARNHNRDTPHDQEPWAFLGTGDQGERLLKTYQASGKFRYSILKWFYSLFIATRGSGTVWRPLSFEFPEEEILYTTNYNERQVLLGSGMMATPCVEKGATNVKAYFPKADWFDFFTGKRVITEHDIKRELIIDTPFNAPAPMFIRAGEIVHTQNVDKVLDTTMLNDEFQLKIAYKKVDNKWEAHGYIMGVKSFDDNTIHNECVLNDCLYSIKAEIDSFEQNIILTEIQFVANSQTRTKPLDELILTGIQFYGLPLEFLEVDEFRTNFAIAQLFNSNLLAASHTMTSKGDYTHPGSFNFTFSKLAIQEGHTLRIEIII